jgi:hypothetical protein
VACRNDTRATPTPAARDKPLPYESLYLFAFNLQPLTSNVLWDKPLAYETTTTLSSPSRLGYDDRHVIIASAVVPI